MKFIILTGLVFSTLSAQANDQGSLHCRQMLSSNPVHTFHLVIGDNQTSGALYRNAVQTAPMTCQQSESNSKVVCADEGQVNSVTVAASGIARVFYRGTEVMALSCYPLNR